MKFFLFFGTTLLDICFQYNRKSYYRAVFNYLSFIVVCTTPNFL